MQKPVHTYQDENGVEQLVVYKYLKDRGWVFMVRDSSSEVYGQVKSVRIVIGNALYRRNFMFHRSCSHYDCHLVDPA